MTVIPTPAVPEKKKALPQAIRVAQALNGVQTGTLIQQAQQLDLSSPIFNVLDNLSDTNTVQPTFLDLFRDERTGGLDVYGTILPAMDGLADAHLNGEWLKGAQKKLALGRKQLFLAMENLEKAENTFKQTVLSKASSIIKSTKGGSKVLKGFRQTVRVQDLAPFGIGKPVNKLQFTSSGTFLVIGVELPAFYQDLSVELDLLGEGFDPITAQKLLREQISQHAALLLDHTSSFSMTTGVQDERIKRAVKIQAQLWHGTTEISARQWMLTYRLEGKTQKHTDIIQSEYLYDGAQDGVLKLSVEIAYSIKVNRNDVDDTLDGLNYLPEMPLYRGVSSDLTPEEAELLAEDEEAEAETEQTLAAEAAQVSVDDEEEPAPAAVIPVPEADKDGLEMVLF